MKFTLFVASAALACFVEAALPSWNSTHQLNVTQLISPTRTSKPIRLSVASNATISTLESTRLSVASSATATSPSTATENKIKENHLVVPLPSQTTSLQPTSGEKPILKVYRPHQQLTEQLIRGIAGAYTELSFFVEEDEFCAIVEADVKTDKFKYEHRFLDETCSKLYKESRALVERALRAEIAFENAFDDFEG